jgi:hypothetical protein
MLHISTFIVDAGGHRHVLENSVTWPRQYITEDTATAYVVRTAPRIIRDYNVNADNYHTLTDEPLTAIRRNVDGHIIEACKILTLAPR